MLTWSMSRIGSSSSPFSSSAASDLSVISSPASAKISPVCGVVEVLGDVLAVEIGVDGAQRLDALVGELARGARGQLAAGLDHDFARVGVDEIDGRLEALHPLGVERHAPAFLGARVDHLLVEGREDFLAVEAEREQQRRHRNLPAPVDARVDDVLGVELDVEPRAAIGNDAGGEQQLARRMALALVVVEEHARRTVHLRDDDALGAVDDEGAVRRHERHVAHVDVLLLDVLDRLGLGLGIDVEHDQAQRHLERRGVGHAALAALVDVVLRRLVFVFDEFELRGLGEIGDREHRLEHRLQTLVGTAALRRVHHEELVVGGLLHLDQVRHRADFPDVAEDLANPFAAGECLRHVAPQSVLAAVTERRRRVCSGGGPGRRTSSRPDRGRNSPSRPRRDLGSPAGRKTRRRKPNASHAKTAERPQAEAGTVQSFTQASKSRPTGLT